MKLTVRQRQVVQGLNDGLSCRQLALQLGISVRTVQEHIRVITKDRHSNQPPIRWIVANAERLLNREAA